jgi:glycerol uptake facilitator-like aquaporin
MSAVFGTAVSPNAPRVAGFGIGLVLLFDILVGGPLTGAAMNPARAFGPAVVAGQWLGHVVYWIGPLAGAILAALVWEYGLLPKAPAPRRRKTD